MTFPPYITPAAPIDVAGLLAAIAVDGADDTERANAVAAISAAVAAGATPQHVADALAAYAAAKPSDVTAAKNALLDPIATKATPLTSPPPFLQSTRTPTAWSSAPRG